MELGASFGLLGQLRVLAHLAACTERAVPCQLGIQCLTDMFDCLRSSSGQKETALHAFYYCERVRLFWSHVGEWTARINPKQLVLLDVSYVVDNADPSYRGEKRVVFITILAVARMVILTMRKKGLYDDASFSHRDLILFFRHQLRVKIRCDGKRLDRIIFGKR